MLTTLVSLTLVTASYSIDCGTREKFEAFMESYGEHVVYRGLAGKDQNTVFELWTNPKTGSWTTSYTDLATDPDTGDVHVRTCSPGSGQGLKKMSLGDEL